VSLGVYISVPFCRTKCSYCNFASGVFSAAQMGRYVERLCADMTASRTLAARHGAHVPGAVDSIYLGGGTPSLLPADELAKLFGTIRAEFHVMSEAEITVECAPGMISDAALEALAACGVNRVSLGVQSFIDQEAASVGRLHTREKIFNDIERLRGAGISNLNVDLIAGLPHQTEASWQESLAAALASGVPHVSVYMLEVDMDSRLGRELIAGGTRYHAHSVPDEDLTAGFYEEAIAQLGAAGIPQYEISNFARSGFESRHNLKYWQRQPYFGFGVDAHSMLPVAGPSPQPDAESVRLVTTDSYDGFFIAAQTEAFPVSHSQAVEESFFLGLRLNRGVSLDVLRSQFGNAVEDHASTIQEMLNAGMLARSGETLRLTPQGRLLSNEVFERFIIVDEKPQPEEELKFQI
jgi:oxygen-independent coproporphyrinogen-3 oxidase